MLHGGWCGLREFCVKRCMGICYKIGKGDQVLDLGESMIKYTQKVAFSSCSHVFTHKCEKVNSKKFQSLLNHHGAQYWIYNMSYTKFGKL
jgi:hypothetical protein